MKVKIINQTTIFDDFFKIKKANLQYEMFDGQMSKTITRLNCERRNSVGAVIFNRDTQKVVLVNQFRFPCYQEQKSQYHEGWISEIIAGIVDEGETSEDAIKRETKEETGYIVEKTEKIGKFYLSPGYSSEQITLYYIEIDKQTLQNTNRGLLSEGENIKIVEYDLKDLYSAIYKNKLEDAKTIIGIQYLLNKHQLLGFNCTD